MEESPLLLTVERAAERLEVGRTKVFELLAAGELESVRIGRSRRIVAASLPRYVQRLRAEQQEAVSRAR